MGYQIIDLKNKSLSTTAVVIAGIYDVIEGTKKALMLSNINIGGTEYNNVYVIPILSGTSYTFAVYGGTITVTDDDEVTYTADENETANA